MTKTIVFLRKLDVLIAQRVYVKKINPDLGGLLVWINLWLLEGLDLNGSQELKIGVFKMEKVDA